MHNGCNAAIQSEQQLLGEYQRVIHKRKRVQPDRTSYLIILMEDISLFLTITRCKNVKSKNLHNRCNAAIQTKRQQFGEYKRIIHKRNTIPLERTSYLILLMLDITLFWQSTVVRIRKVQTCTTNVMLQYKKSKNSLVSNSVAFGFVHILFVQYLTLHCVCTPCRCCA